MYLWIRHNELYKLMEIFFFNFEFVFKILAENRTMFKRIERHEPENGIEKIRNGGRGMEIPLHIYPAASKCNVLYINGFVSTSSTI